MQSARKDTSGFSDCVCQSGRSCGEPGLWWLLVLALETQWVTQAASLGGTCPHFQTIRVAAAGFRGGWPALAAPGPLWQVAGLWLVDQGWTGEHTAPGPPTGHSDLGVRPASTPLPSPLVPHCEDLNLRLIHRDVRRRQV